jgi:flagellar motor switch protein FliN
MTKIEAVSSGKSETSLALDHVEVEIEAVLGSRRTTIGELKALVENDLVPLTTSLSDPVELRVNGRTIGFGEIVAVGDSFAVRVTSISQ